MAFGVAATTLVGQSLGADNERRLRPMPILSITWQWSCLFYGSDIYTFLTPTGTSIHSRCGSGSDRRYSIEDFSLSPTWPINPIIFGWSFERSRRYSLSSYRLPIWDLGRESSGLIYLRQNLQLGPDWCLGCYDIGSVRTVNYRLLALSLREVEADPN